MSEQENGGFTPNENETQQTPETADPQNSEYHSTEVEADASEWGLCDSIAS